jgi:hypothetical protein
LPDPLDRIADTTAVFGTYQGLTRDPRFRFSRRRAGDELAEVSRIVKVERQAGGTDDGEVQIG